MIITTNYLSELLNRDIVDTDNEVLDEIKKCEVEDVTVIRNTIKNTVIKFTVSKGRSVMNALQAGEVLQIVIKDNEVYDIEDYDEPSVLMITAAVDAAEISFCDKEGIEVKGEVTPYQRPTTDSDNKYNGFEDTVRCHWDLHCAEMYSLSYPVPDEFYSLEFNRDNILKAVNQLSVVQYKAVAVIK